MYKQFYCLQVTSYWANRSINHHVAEVKTDTSVAVAFLGISEQNMHVTFVLLVRCLGQSLNFKPIDLKACCNSVTIVKHKNSKGCVNEM